MSVISLMTQEASLMTQSTETRSGTGAVEQEYEEEVFLGYFEPEPPIGLEGEDIEDRNTQLGRWFGAVPPTLVFTGFDQIILDGKVMDLTGPPRPMHNPRTNATSHIELSLRVVE